MDGTLSIGRWWTLWVKELRFHWYSLSGIVFILCFLIICGCLLWLVPGSYNIPANGYASFSSFFTIAPLLLLFLIPALAMRTLADEKRMNTLLLLGSRPITMNSILSAKITALFLTVVFTLIPTLIYVWFIYFYGDPVGNLDMGAVFSSYIGLFFLIGAFICLSVFASSLTDNQVIALIIAMLLCGFFYWGFDLLSIGQWGFFFHYQSIRRGLMETSGLFYFLMVGCLFYGVTLVTLGEKIRLRPVLLSCVFGILFLLLSMFVHVSWDWTQDQRYTLHPVSEELLKDLEYQVEIDLFLAGNLNPGFRRLQESTLLLLGDLSKKAVVPFHYTLIDPYKKGKGLIESLQQQGIQGISVNEHLANGRISQQIVYPYALVKYGNSKLAVHLLVNRTGRSGEENLNESVEMLEYRLIHALDLLSRKESKRIVFLEGHGELPEETIDEAIDLLSYEYTIDRGALSGTPGELDPYDLVVVAGPQTAFSEQDKYILDQYLMRGGKLLWFIDGSYLSSYQELIDTGKTLSLAKDLNLNDWFFSYGLRMEPMILQDVQSLYIPVPVEKEGEETDFVSRPWYYSALLIPNQRLEITRGLSLVKASFAGTISLVGENTTDDKEVLLTSSSQAHTVQVPAQVTLEETERQPDGRYFNKKALPVAVLVKPPLASAFQNRSHFYVQEGYPFVARSDSGQMIVVASGDLITDPLGYDPYSQTQFSNPEFIRNAVNYLTDSKGISVLKNKSLHIHLLNRKKLQDNRQAIVFWNVVFPPLIGLIVFGILYILRKRKYERKAES